MSLLNCVCGNNDIAAIAIAIVIVALLIGESTDPNTLALIAVWLTVLADLFAAISATALAQQENSSNSRDNTKQKISALLGSL